MKKVHWTYDTKDTVLKRNCLCEGCTYCIKRINKENNLYLDNTVV